MQWFLDIKYFLFFPAAMILISSCTPGRSKGKSPPPPNLIIILTDDLGYADVGFNGSVEIPTPNIDRIANEGVKFTNGYVSFPVCGPSRAGLITGRYQGRFGFSRNPLFAPNDPNMGLPIEEETLAEALHKAEYKCAALGKWHLGAHPSQRPLVQGFDDFFGFLTGGHRYFPEEWTLADEYEVTSQYEAYKTKLLRNAKRIEETEYLTDALSREAAGYIEKYRANPFFIYLAYNAPHGPLQATEKYLNRFKHIKDRKRRTYAAMVSAVDDGVGLVLDKLDELQLAENTMVFFLSDNGGPAHIKASNAPLRGYKGNLFEGGYRVPFAMRWPAKIEAGQSFYHPIISLDIFATIIGQNKGKIKTKNLLDGVDLIPFITNPKKGQPHDQLYWRKFDSHEIAIRQGPYKFTNFSGPSQLYHLSDDVGEQTNLFQINSDMVHQLEKNHRQWLSQLVDPIFMGLRQDSVYNTLHPNRFKRPK